MWVCKMLDAFIIDKIKKEKEQGKDNQPIYIDIPLIPERPEESSEDEQDDDFQINYELSTLILDSHQDPVQEQYN